MPDADDPVYLALTSKLGRVNTHKTHRRLMPADDVVNLNLPTNNPDPRQQRHRTVGAHPMVRHLGSGSDARPGTFRTGKGQLNTPIRVGQWHDVGCVSADGSRLAGLLFFGCG